jgi:hypothetical protein
MGNPARRPGCPNPDKQRYTSREAAERDLLKLAAKFGDQETLHPYECACGLWHLGRSRSGWTYWRQRRPRDWPGA